METLAFESVREHMQNFVLEKWNVWVAERKAQGEGP